VQKTHTAKNRKFWRWAAFTGRGGATLTTSKKAPGEKKCKSEMYRNETVAYQKDLNSTQGGRPRWKGKTWNTRLRRTSQSKRIHQDRERGIE